jgi:hypothetical protein
MVKTSHLRTPLNCYISLKYDRCLFLKIGKIFTKIIGHILFYLKNIGRFKRKKPGRRTNEHKENFDRGF